MTFLPLIRHVPNFMSIFNNDHQLNSLTMITNLTVYVRTCSVHHTAEYTKVSIKQLLFIRIEQGHHRNLCAALTNLFATKQCH